MALKSFFLAILFIASSAQAQVLYKFRFHGGLKNWTDCQANQDRIYQTYLSRLDSQIARLTMGYEIELNYRGEGWAADQFADAIIEKTAERMIIEQYARHLRSFKFNQGNELPFSSFHPTLNIDLILEQAVISTTFKLERARQPSVFAAKKLKNYLLKNIATQLASNVARQVFTKTFVSTLISGAIAKNIGRNLTMQALKATSLRFGKDVLKSSVKGLWTLITIPLSGSTLPEETKWTDVLSDEPKLMLNPEVMRDAKIGYGYPWMTHCAALANRSLFVEYDIKKMLSRMEVDFLEQARRLDESDVTEEEASPWIQQRPVIDNTRVHVNIERYRYPVWAQLKI